MVGENELNINKSMKSKLKYLLAMCLGLLFVGCCYTSDRDVKQDIKEIKLLISQGGRDVIVGTPRDTVLSPALQDQVYEMKLQDGVLTTSRGLGKKTLNTINIGFVEQKQAVSIPKSTLDSILSLAGEIVAQKEYKTSNHHTDSWLVKLQINHKTYVYYLGESLSTLNIYYLNIVDILVDQSAIKIADYR